MNISKSLMVAVLLIMSLTSFSIGNAEINDVMVAKPIVVTAVAVPVVKFVPTTTKVGYARELPEFLNDLGKRESNDHYHVVSKRGYLGRYQFHQLTLHRIGIYVTDSAFLADTALQDSAEVLLLKDNNWALRDIIHRYAGHRINGIYITRSGILAGAHLVGTCGVRAFFNPNIPCRTKDYNGTTVGEYINLFARYRLNL